MYPFALAENFKILLSRKCVIFRQCISALPNSEAATSFERKLHQSPDLPEWFKESAPVARPPKRSKKTNFTYMHRCIVELTNQLGRQVRVVGKTSLNLLIC